MQILSKSQVFEQIGKRGIFQSFPDLINKLRYKSGISGFDSIPSKTEFGNIVSFFGHPSGIKIQFPSGGEITALSYSEIKCFDLLDLNEERYQLEIQLNNSKTIRFNFLIAKTDAIIGYFKQIGIERYKTPRTEVEIQEQIGLLKQAYALPADFKLDLERQIKTGMSKVKTLHIEGKRLSFGGEIVDLNTCKGICYSKTETSVSGIKANTEYKIIIHRSEEKPLKISFVNAQLGGEKRGEEIYAEILDALFDVVIRGQIQTWLTAFIDNKRAAAGDLELAREGIYYIKKGNEVHIPWEDLTISSFEMNMTFKSKYNKRLVFIKGLSFDTETWPLVNFVEFLFADRNRLRLLIAY